MKKYMKKLRLVALICILCIAATMLSSCNLIDGLKEQRFVYTDEMKNTIEYKGKRFVYIDNPKDFSLNFTYDVYGYIVDKDVPLLLLDMLGSYCRYSEELGLIKLDAGSLYCLESKYEEYNELFENAVLDHYKIDYEYMNHETREVENVCVVLEDEVTELINGTVLNVEGVKSMDGQYGFQYLWIDKCDKTGFVHETDVLELYRDPQNDVCGIRMLDSDYNYVYYEIPEEFEGIIEELFQKYFHDDTYGYYDQGSGIFTETEYYAL